MEKNIIEQIMQKTGLNVSQLADELTEFRGKKVYRQQVQGWLYNRTGMTLSTAQMLEDFKRGFKKRPRNKLSPRASK